MGKRRQPKSDYTRKSPDAAAAASRNEEKDEGENNAGDEWNRRSLYKVNKRKVVGGWNCPTNSLPICNELQRHRRNAGNVSSEKTGRLCPVSEFRERLRSSNSIILISIPLLALASSIWNNKTRVGRRRDDTSLIIHLVHRLSGRFSFISSRRSRVTGTSHGAKQQTSERGEKEIKLLFFLSFSKTPSAVA